MLTFENAIIKKYWPAENKVDDDIIRQVHIQTEVEIDNSMQVAELYNNMVRGLVKVVLLDTLTGEEYTLPPVTIRPFNVKQKSVKTGKGREAEISKTEIASMTLVSKLSDNNGSTILSDLYRFFHIQITINMYELQLADTVETDESEEEDELI